MGGLGVQQWDIEGYLPIQEYLERQEWVISDS